MLLLAIRSVFRGEEYTRPGLRARQARPSVDG